ncbi:MULTISPECIES: DUF6966 domain-containing protein [Pseudomonas syringae group]|uniref:DUF6966 domain-containing protein n=2 Tax=Pseudomonas amygdali TaxID=47877 RepID=A0AB35R0A7_PSEA0|nr:MULTISPECIES: hypothetical protein [Pseudomonas syringae group]AVB17122.1 hypothetical protein BKM19_028840 [Pseudomonas amygdali pv. morsprunorum]KWS56259.1 hypothetical protein AL056_02895 [Pseudomonas amygdali pv. morsprunorum]KWS66442.1 hypothetical protein AL054_24655 [Pseudomonas amygdali pv. morsprunorum]MBD1106696.1 hypothetical protein [Pseudomonas amygdali pv. morsprunorum]MBI6814725.1 hypothetical protein [Pseudomonas amygdali]
MNKTKEINALIKKASCLLRQYERSEWADKLDAYVEALFDDADYALSKIISLYGGSGSINDIVLYSNGKFLFEKNNRLHELLSKIYSLCSGAN